MAKRKKDPQFAPVSLRQRKKAKGQNTRLDPHLAQALRNVTSKTFGILKTEEIVMFALSVYAVYLNYMLLWMRSLQQDNPLPFFALVIGIVSITVLVRQLIQKANQEKLVCWVGLSQIFMPALLIPVWILFFARGASSFESVILALSTMLSFYLSVRTAFRMRSQVASKPA